MKDKLILNNNFIIELESGTSLSDMRVLFADKGAMREVWNELTEDNLSEVTIKNGDGIVVSILKGLLLVSETSIVQPDGTILTSFNLREKTGIEKRMDALEEEIEVHDGAIMDTAEMLSRIAVIQEGGGE